MNKSELILKKEKAELLKSLGIELPENEVEEVAEKLLEHFNKIIIETLIVNLSAEDRGDIADSLDSDRLEAMVQDFAARTPGLFDKIEEALNNEFEVIRIAYAK